MLRLKVGWGSVLESELGQKWTYGALKAKTSLKGKKIQDLKGF